MHKAEIQAAIKVAGSSQAKIAKAVGLTETTVSDAVAGKKKNDVVAAEVARVTSLPMDLLWPQWYAQQTHFPPAERSDPDGQIDITLFGMCESALRRAYLRLRPDVPKHVALRATAICKVYNKAVRGLRPNSDAALAVNNAAEAFVEWEGDSPELLDRAVLHDLPTVEATGGSIAVAKNIKASIIKT